MSVTDEQSIRPCLAETEREGSLLRIDKTVNPRFEVLGVGDDELE